MKRALVTGGAGFIGSHLVERLLADGWTVRVVDDESTGARGNLRGCWNAPGLEFVAGDVGDAEVLSAALEPRPQWVFHLAAAVGVALVADAPVETIQRNIQPTHLLLQMLAALHAESRSGAPPLRMFLASTSEVYGKNPKATWNEEDDLVWGPTSRLRWCYGASKAIDEFLAIAYARSCGLPVVIGRFFNVVGPRQTGRYGMVLPRLVEAARTGAPMPIHDDGRQVRCFAHVADVVDAMLLLMDASDAPGEVYNIGGDEPLSVLALSEQVARVLGKPHRIRTISYEAAYGTRFEDVRHRVPDLSKIRAAVGWRAARSLDQAILEIAAEQERSDG